MNIFCCESYWQKMNTKITCLRAGDYFFEIFSGKWNKKCSVMSVYSEGESHRTLTIESRAGEIPYSQRHDASAER